MSDYWVAFPPPHLVLRIIAMGLGAKFRTGSDKAPVPVLNEVEQQLMVTGEVIPFDQIPEYVRQYMKPEKKHA